MGANHKGALVTINDRKSGYAKIKLVKSKDSKKVAKAIIQALMPYKNHLHTITSDNGKEFSEHQYISEKLGLNFTLQSLIAAGKGVLMKTSTV